MRRLSQKPPINPEFGQRRMAFSEPLKLAYDGMYSVDVVSRVLELSGDQVLDLAGHNQLRKVDGSQFNSRKKWELFGPYSTDSILGLASLFGYTREDLILGETELRRSDIITKFEIYYMCKEVGGILRHLERELDVSNLPCLTPWDYLDMRDLREMLKLNHLKLDELACKGMFLNFGLPPSQSQRFDLIQPTALAYLFSRLTGKDLNQILLPEGETELKVPSRRSYPLNLNMRYAIPIQPPSGSVLWLTWRAQRRLLQIDGGDSTFMGEHLEFFVSQLNQGFKKVGENQIRTQDLEIRLQGNCISGIRHIESSNPDMIRRNPEKNNTSTGTGFSGRYALGKGYTRS